jgi:murein DD-endopeptidase MepM/ murein hydrolase activator NlpD
MVAPVTIPGSALRHGCRSDRAAGDRPCAARQSSLKPAMPDDDGGVVMRSWYALAALVWATVAAASELHLEGALVQGGLVRGQAPPGSAVWLDDRALRVSAEGWFVFGFGRDAPESAALVVRRPDGREDRRVLAIARRAYDIQRIDGLPPREVTPSEQDLARIRAEAELIEAAKRRDTDGRGFTEEVAWPALGPISGVFGSQRILNGEPRAPGTPVGAMAHGVVSLAEPDLYFTGGTVMIDHGHGLHSIYVHLQDVLVEVGQEVAQGTLLGTVGSTGRATGAHLHWGVYWFDQAVDPALLVGPMPNPLG